MKNQQRLLPSLDSLEGRLALSTLAPAVAPPPPAPADVVQNGNFEGQFGDQTTADTPAGVDTGTTPGTPGGGQLATETDL